MFGGYLAFGITTMFGLQALVNIGVVLGSLPTKGLPLPFISYGGTSLLMSLFMAGVLANISARNPEPGDSRCCPAHAPAARARARNRALGRAARASSSRSATPAARSTAPPPPPPATSCGCHERAAPLRVLIAGGGTGRPSLSGHRDRRGDHGPRRAARCCSSARRAASRPGWSRRPASRWSSMEVSGLKRMGLRGRAARARAAAQGVPRARARILRRYRPDVVLGVGGYASGPLVFAAALLGYPTAIQEQNSRPGFTNRVLGRLVRRVFVAFDDAAARSPAARSACSATRCAALPRPRRRAARRDATTGARSVILGGSQGSHAVNELASGDGARAGRARPAAARSSTRPAPTEIDEMQVNYAALGYADRVEVRAFIDDMPAVLSQAAVCVARARAR